MTSMIALPVDQAVFVVAASPNQIALLMQVATLKKEQIGNQIVVDGLLLARRQLFYLGEGKCQLLICHRLGSEGV